MDKAMTAYFASGIVQELEWMARILLAGLCGCAIGYERESRRKTAGLRTHVLVAVSSALMIVLSKYGFSDVLGQYVRLDPSRIAAGTVAAIGFLGSGVIFARNKSVSGVTTSAGIWATLGVGMAIGAGMYVLGIATTLLVVLVEIFLGRRGKLPHIIREVHQIEIEYLGSERTGSLAARACEVLEEKYEGHILRSQIKHHGESMSLHIMVKATGRYLDISGLTEEYPEITKISVG